MNNFPKGNDTKYGEILIDEVHRDGDNKKYSSKYRKYAYIVQHFTFKIKLLKFQKTRVVKCIMIF